MQERPGAVLKLAIVAAASVVGLLQVLGAAQGGLSHGFLRCRTAARVHAKGVPR